ncbi:MAG: TVP38/TMEM64 family protein [Hyphomonadaceae bacterium]
MSKESEDESGEEGAGAHAKPRRAHRLGQVALIAVLALALGLAWRAGVFDLLSFETLRGRRAELLAFVADNRALAVAAFIGLYALVTWLAIPGALWITIAGGFLFGLPGGVAATSIGATLGATALFLSARYLFADALRRRAAGFLQRFQDGFQRNAVFYLLTIRFAPIVPFFIANIAPALLGVRLSTFAATTFVGILPGVAAYSWVGAGLGATFDAGQTPDLARFARELAPAFLALAVLSLAPVIVGRIRAKTPAKADSKESA